MNVLNAYVVTLINQWKLKHRNDRMLYYVYKRIKGNDLKNAKFSNFLFGLYYLYLYSLPWISHIKILLNFILQLLEDIKPGGFVYFCLFFSFVH